MTLFDRDHIIGIFRGFSHGGMEFHADLVMPYRDEFQSSPMHGQFVLVQLEHEQEAVFGRITTISAQGRLVSPIGEDYAVRAVRDDRQIPDELRDQYLKYKVEIRVLGVLRQEGDKIDFVPSHRRLPHVGARVAFPSPKVLADLANADAGGDSTADLGFLAFGEFVYAGNDDRLDTESWMVVKSPAIVPKFEIGKLVSRRSFVFARAGFGKSNLVKLLFSNLYTTDPTVRRRGGKSAPVGTVIFDPDGEYFWPDPHGRPGLCDVAELTDRLVVFTNREAPSPAYQSFVVDGIKLDIRQLGAARVLGIALPPERQDQQNVAKLKGLTQAQWSELVDLVNENGNRTDAVRVRQLLGLDAKDEAQTFAAIGNMTKVVKSLHDPSSQLLTTLKCALSDGKLCVVDISQMRGPQGLQLAGIILADIFEHNQTQFTEAVPKTIPTIAVLEEAQSVLGNSHANEDGPFTAWVKEGRKYDLGAVLITQQPGSIPGELLSQGDNFFVFHLLAQGDLGALKKANAHFSDDLLSSLLNEPLVGHGIFWSSAPGDNQHARPYPLSVRILNFNKAHALRDPEYNGQPLHNYASVLRGTFQGELARAVEANRGFKAPVDGPEGSLERGEAPPPDASRAYRARAVSGLVQDARFMSVVDQGGGWWGSIQKIISAYAPAEPVVPSKFQWAYENFFPVLSEVLGAKGVAWETETRTNSSGENKVWVAVLQRPAFLAAADEGSREDDAPPF